MFIVRLLLAVFIAVGVGALALYLITGQQVYLRYLGRAALIALGALLLMGVGMIAGRFLGVLL